MRFHKFDLNLLVALDALLRERSVTRAAERLHLSQPAMSNALNRLRNYFDDELLVQVGRQLDLTPRAEILRNEVSDILLRVETSITAQPQFDCSRSDRIFKLFVSDYSMEVLIPYVLVLAAKQRSTVRFKLEPQVRNPARSLERGDADLLIIPEYFCSTEHPTHPIFRDRFVCVVWDNSVHARIGINVKQYKRARHIVMQPLDTHEEAGTIDSMHLQSQGIERQVAVSTYSFATMPCMVVGTDLIATVFETLALRLQPALPIALLPMPTPAPPLIQVMQWHKYRSLDPGLIWLRQLIEEAAAMAMKQPQLAMP